MLFIKFIHENGWRELDKEKMMAFNYFGGYHYINEKSLSQAEICEYKDWHELYLAKHYCPLEVNKKGNNVWISPEGKYYGDRSHEVVAEDLLEIIYGIEDSLWPGDELEEKGWIRAASSLMWQIRFDEWTGKKLTRKQYDALYEWCNYHNKEFPKNINVV